QVRSAGADDAVLAMVPPVHLFGLTAGLLGPLACGARVVFPGAPLPNRLLASLREDGITFAPAVPALVDELSAQIAEELRDAGILETETPDRDPRRIAEALRSWESVRSGVRDRIGRQFHTIIVGGAALDPAWLQVLGQLRIRLEVGYGLTETSPIVSLGFADECPPGSAGRAIPGVEVRVDPHGEVLVRGPNVMRGYFKDPDATAAAFDDGWFRTGDRGRLDDDGFLFVTGRIKEAMVTASGETIYPDEVETHYAHPLFAELCVAPVSGPNGNDIPVLFVVPRSPDLVDDRLQDAFAGLRAAAPARLRVSRMVRLENPLPRTMSGKIKRRLVAQESTHVTGS
ncbi:MAG: fatty acid--CoA ligase family protein, partial [Acidobacteriota bacterium]|nr:fatty acid--CoA ligase family protein [Acidobacteriota bacterium]